MIIGTLWKLSSLTLYYMSDICHYILKSQILYMFIGLWTYLKIVWVAEKGVNICVLFCYPVSFSEYEVLQPALPSCRKFLTGSVRTHVGVYWEDFLNRDLKHSQFILSMKSPLAMSIVHAQQPSKMQMGPHFWEKLECLVWGSVLSISISE